MNITILMLLLVVLFALWLVIVQLKNIQLNQVKQSVLQKDIISCLKNILIQMEVRLSDCLELKNEEENEQG